MARHVSSLFRSFSPSTSPSIAVPKPRILIVGNLSVWAARGKTLPDVEGVRFVEFPHLSAFTLRQDMPDVVLSQLFGDRFDALDLAQLLGEIGFAGQYRVIADNIPDPSFIIEEVRSIAPHLDFDLTNWRLIR